MTSLSLALTKTLGFDVQAFVEKAIEGGWRGLEWTLSIRTSDNMVWGESNLGEMHGRNASEVILDPAAWRAVGKVEGWRSLDDENWQDTRWEQIQPEWQVNMHRFLYVLIELDDTSP